MEWTKADALSEWIYKLIWAIAARRAEWSVIKEMKWVKRVELI